MGLNCPLAECAFGHGCRGSWCLDSVASSPLGGYAVRPTLLCTGLLVAALLAACATRPGGRETVALARYEAAAGEPVPSFRFLRLDGYTVLGSDRVVIWTRPREAFLLAVDAPCSELPWVSAIGLTSSLGGVYARFDAVLAGRQRCRIREIRPVDVAALREAERKARSGTVEASGRDGEGDQSSGT